MSIQTIKQTSDTQSNLYFEYIYNLRKFQNSLLKISTIEQIELLSSEVMAYFDCHYQLKVFFKEQLNNFLKTDEVAGDFDSIYRLEGILKFLQPMELENETNQIRSSL